MQRNIKSLEDFFWKFLLINPLLDILNGVYIKIMQLTYGELYRSANISITPSLVFRMAVLLLFVGYILLVKDKKAILTALPIGAAWVMSVISELFFVQGDVALFTDIQYFARFCYNIAVMLVYRHLFYHSGLSARQLMRKLSRLMSITLIMLSVAIIIPYIFHMGFTTYADRFGFRGTRGFFYSGNDITGMFMAILPVATCYFLALPERALTKANRFFFAVGPAMTLLCMLLIGTKTAFVCTGATLGSLLIVGIVFWYKKNDKTVLKRLGYMLLLALIIAIIVSLLGMLFSQRSLANEIEKTLDGFVASAEEDVAKTLILSGRGVKLNEAFTDYREAGPFGWLFGVGRGSQELTIEMDLFEVAFYYGIFGFIVMLWSYFHAGFSFLGKFLKNFNLLSFGVFISLGLSVAYLTMAGHVLFSVTSGFYFSFVLVYAGLIFPKEKPRNVEQGQDVLA